jgi:ParB/RepB/Spo0J family partition protein
MNKLAEVAFDDLYVQLDFNTRFSITPESVSELKEDIKKRGLLEPLLVTESKIFQTSKPYVLLAGFRRYTAIKLLHEADPKLFVTIPCNVLPVKNEIEARVINFTENYQRSDLTLLEEAYAIKHLYDAGLSRQEISDMLGVTMGWAQNRLTILKLPEDTHIDMIKYQIGIIDIQNLYKVYHNDGVDAFYEAFRKLKVSKERGFKFTPKSKVKRSEKKIRPKAEIQELINHLLVVFGEGIWTYCLAWAAGNISDKDLDALLKIYARDNNVEFVSHMESTNDLF